jgi:hypothetical protein
MRRLLLTLALVCLGPASAIAQERLVDGVLGVLAGAVVAGPVGAVVGGVVGASAGPAISSSWGLSGDQRAHHHHHHHHYYRRHARY